ncbi:MAG: hypothetical protein KC468_17210, partial [Myxococcales bacterium]|nr:hypothetical protein [Myxococcales bacterium]
MGARSESERDRSSAETSSTEPRETAEQPAAESPETAASDADAPARKRRRRRRRRKKKPGEGEGETDAQSSAPAEVTDAAGSSEADAGGEETAEGDAPASDAATTAEVTTVTTAPASTQSTPASTASAPTSTAEADDAPPVKALEDGGPVKPPERQEDEATARESKRPSRGERRKRQRKSKRGAGKDAAAGHPAGAEGAPAEDAGEQASDSRADTGPTGVFAEYLPKIEGGRRHAFTTGSIVAGRVEKIVEDLITLDLFGKGVAIMEVGEPRTLRGAHAAGTAPEGERSLASDDRRESVLAGALTRGELFAIAWDQPVDKEAAERRRRLTAAAESRALPEDVASEDAEAAGEGSDEAPSSE